MSNFKCDKCGMTNIDCGKDGFKTPKEIELEARVKELEEELNAQFTDIEKTNRCENCKHHYTDYDCLHYYCNIMDKEVSINDSFMGQCSMF